MPHFVKLSQSLSQTLSKPTGVHLYMIRHGQSLANRAGSIVGWTDSKLSVVGREQSHKLYKGFHSHIDKFNSIHSSDLSRCVDTINFALGFPSKPITKIESLRQMNFGDEEGLHFDSLSQQQKNKRNSLEYRAPNGQSWPQARARAMKYLSKLPEGHHLISTHGGLICALAYPLGLKNVVPNCSVVSLELCSQSKELKNINFIWEFKE